MAGFVGIHGGVTVPRRCAVETIENRPALDVAKLAKLGAFTAGARTVMSWPDGAAVLRFELNRLHVEIEGAAVQVIEVEIMPATTGGTFALFRCPFCSKRRQVLRELNHRVACAPCLNLDYQSRHEDRGNPLRVAARLRLQLGGDPSPLVPLPTRPTGRRAANEYDRLVKRIAALEWQALARLRVAHNALERFARNR